ncbi:hypothetical protein NO1_2258, partial [Candidatus Termititenax aidoneus]
KELYDSGKITEIQYNEALGRPYQTAPVSRGVVSGHDIPPTGAAPNEYKLLTPTSDSPSKTREELLADGYTAAQIDAMTKANEAGYSATETTGAEIVVVAGQPNPDIAANPSAYKTVGNPYGRGEVHIVKSSEAAALAARLDLSSVDDLIMTPTDRPVYSPTAVRAEELPEGVPADMCISVSPDPPYDTTSFDPASRSYTLAEVNAFDNSEQYGPTGNKIGTDNVTGHSEQTVSSIPADANASDYLEVLPDEPYGDIDSNAQALTAAQLAVAAPGSYVYTGEKTGNTITVQGRDRPTEDAYGTPYNENDCTVASWGAVDSSVPPETIDWPHTSEPGFKYAYDGSYQTDPRTILSERPAADSVYSGNHYEIRESELPGITIDVPAQANSISDNNINLT